MDDKNGVRPSSPAATHAAPPALEITAAGRHSGVAHPADPSVMEGRGGISFLGCLPGGKRLKSRP